jgi:hypothetical protein
MLSREAQSVRLAVHPDGFTPGHFGGRASWCAFSLWKVCALVGLNDVIACGRLPERYELCFHADTGLWFVLRGPTRLGRALSRLETMPRYSLPVWRRRSFRRSMTTGRQGSRGGGNADGFALVR